MTAWLPSVRLATTENLDDDGGMPAKLLTPGTLDGKTVNAGDEILAKDETNPILNGTWIAAANPLDPMTRRGDTFEPESTVRVSEGDRNGHTQWACKAQGTIVLDTILLSFLPQNLVRYVDT